jgi:hypothetical protein
VTRHIAPFVVLSLVAGVGILTPPGAAHAQKKPAAAKKPPAPGSGKAGGPVVLGTKQLPGDFGQVGTTYTIGARSPLNFTLRSAEYSAAPLNVGNETIVPNAEQKLLVLRYTVHNPQPRETGYSWTGLTFTAVDANDTNHEAVSRISREGDPKMLDISLKPAQKVDVYTAILVPAQGVIPKLIVQREAGAPVIRYDLRGKARPLPAPYADPADPSGATARKEVPVAAGAYHPLGLYDVKLESAAYVPGAVGSVTPGDGKRLLSAVFSIRNRSTGPKTYSWTTLGSWVKDGDGEKTEMKSTVLKATRDESATGDLKPGEEARLRLLYELPSSVTAKTLYLYEGSDTNRVLALELPAATAP